MSYPTVIPSPTSYTNYESDMGDDYINPDELRSLTDEDLVILEYRRRNPVESDFNYNGIAGVYDIQDDMIIFAGTDGGFYEVPLNSERPGYVLTDEYELQVYSVLEPELAA